MLYVTLNSIKFEWVSDRNVIRQHQPQTISAALEPGRSTYGTLQQPGYPSTVTKKYLWIFVDVPATLAQVDSLESMIENNSVYSYTFIDALHTARRGDANYTTNVRLLVGPDWLGPSSYSPQLKANIWPVSLSLIEI